MWAARPPSQTQTLAPEAAVGPETSLRRVGRLLRLPHDGPALAQDAPSLGPADLLVFRAADGDVVVLALSPEDAAAMAPLTEGPCPRRDLASSDALTAALVEAGAVCPTAFGLVRP